MSTAVIDLDCYKYLAASVGEKKSVIVTHKKSGKSMEVDTRTDFYGHWKKKDGGKLAEINKSTGKNFLWDDFEYEDKSVLEPIENVLHTAKVLVEKSLKESGANKYIGFLGKGDSFRVEMSTLLKYKGNRTQPKPAYLEEVTEYLRKKYSAEIVTGIEADDACVMACYKQPDKFIIGLDKDFWGCPSKFYNINQPERGITNCDKFGKLWLDKKGKVQGEGRIFLYYQCTGLDAADNYKANCVSKIKWGDKSAFESLKDCKNDKEAVSNMIRVYKHLYPKPKKVKGWRGDTLDIDWKYVLNENFQMARMLRWEGDSVHIDDIINNLKINPDTIKPWGET